MSTWHTFEYVMLCYVKLLVMVEMELDGNWKDGKAEQS